jgi:hypothetical protein
MSKILYLAPSLLAVFVAGCSASTGDEAEATDQAFSSSVQITCESSNYAYTSCGVPGDRIVSARVTRQLSTAPCDQGRGWGYQQNYIWVNNGCRAEFEVWVSGSHPSGGGGIRVLSATYGGNTGISQGNVNYYLTQACDGRSSCDYLVSVNVLGDPAPGRAKDFSVLWHCGDPNHPYSAHLNPEANGQHVYLSCGFGPPPPPPPPSCGALESGQSLYRDQSVTSCDGRTSFTHQGDGNVVVYHDGRAIASTGIQDSSTNVLQMQNDGNLVQYAYGNRVLWSSNTPGHYGARLVVQDDCNVVIYEPSGNAIWHTNTAGCYQH